METDWKIPEPKSFTELLQEAFKKEDEMNMATQTPMTEDQSIEQQIQSAGKTAPRITPGDIQATIRNAHYFTAGDALHGSGKYVPPDSPLWLLTICVLELKNGFTVTGESAPVSHQNFDAEIGRKIALAKATEKIWPLEGYLLKDRLIRGA